MIETIEKAKQIIEKDNKPAGYNIGMNCGEAAGQTVYHFHCHIIPRYLGDMEEPRVVLDIVLMEKDIINIKSSSRIEDAFPFVLHHNKLATSFHYKYINFDLSLSFWRFFIGGFTSIFSKS